MAENAPYGTQTKRRTLALWLGAAVFLVVTFFLVRNLTRDRLPVRAAEVRRGELTSTISTNGKVEPQQNFEAHSPSAAIVRRVLVREGDHVSSGQLLLTLDDLEAESRLASARSSLITAQANESAMAQGGTQEEILLLDADIARATAERDQAQRSLDTVSRLQATGAASASEVAAAEQRLQAAAAQLAALNRRKSGRFGTQDLSRSRAAVADAGSAVAAARQVVNQSNVRAPFAGTVYSLAVQPTEFVEQGRLLLQVADLKRVQIRAYFDEPEIGRLAVGQPITVVWDAKPGRQWHGSIARVPSTIITYGTRNVGEVLITVSDNDGTLLPNTNVTVTVTTARHRDVLIVPRESLHTESGKTFVYKIAGSRLQRTPVEIGTLNLTDVEILSGLEVHDLVARTTTNGQSLEDGAPVTVER